MGARFRRRVSGAKQGQKVRAQMQGAAQVFRSMADEISRLRQEVGQLRGLLDVLIEASGAEDAVRAVLEKRAAAQELAKMAGGPPPEGVEAGPPVSLVTDDLVAMQEGAPAP